MSSDMTPKSPMVAAFNFLKNHANRVDQMPDDWAYAVFESNKMQVNWLADAFEEFSKAQLAESQARVAMLEGSFGELLGVFERAENEFPFNMGRYIDPKFVIEHLQTALSSTSQDVQTWLDERDARVRAEELEATPIDEWHEDMGSQLWWKFPIVEAPYCGSPLDSEFCEESYTHFTRIPIPIQPTTNKKDEVE